MAQGRFTKIISMIKWIRASRLPMKAVLSLGRIIFMMKWIRTSRLSMKNSLSFVRYGRDVAMLTDLVNPKP